VYSASRKRHISCRSVNTRIQVSASTRARQRLTCSQSVSQFHSIAEVSVEITSMPPNEHDRTHARSCQAPVLSIVSARHASYERPNSFLPQSPHYTDRLPLTLLGRSLSCINILGLGVQNSKTFKRQRWTSHLTPTCVLARRTGL
jgi:hypothetical protein